MRNYSNANIDLWVLLSAYWLFLFDSMLLPYTFLGQLYSSRWRFRGGEIPIL